MEADCDAATCRLVQSATRKSWLELLPSLLQMSSQAVLTDCKRGLPLKLTLAEATGTSLLRLLCLLCGGADVAVCHDHQDPMFPDTTLLSQHSTPQTICKNMLPAVAGDTACSPLHVRWPLQVE